jgi:hypothetical protein
LFGEKGGVGLPVVTRTSAGEAAAMAAPARAVKREVTAAATMRDRRRERLRGWSMI